MSHIEIHPYVSRGKENSFTNGNCCRPLMYGRNGENLKLNLIRHMQRVPTCGFVSRSRIPVTVKEELKQTKSETKDFSDTLQLRWTPNIDTVAIRISHQLHCDISYKLDLFS